MTPYDSNVYRHFNTLLIRSSLAFSNQMNLITIPCHILMSVSLFYMYFFLLSVRDELFRELSIMKLSHIKTIGRAYVHLYTLLFPIAF